MAVNHLPWSTARQSARGLPLMTDHPSLGRLAAMGVDFVEVANGQTFDLQSACVTLHHVL